MVAADASPPKPPGGRGLLATPGRRRLLFTALYFTEGAPIGFVWWMLPAFLRRQGLGADEITGLTSILVLPWAGKFLWSPWIDRARGPSLKRWIAGSQALMAASLLPLLVLDLAQGFRLAGALLLLHALAASTQDAAIDALAVRSTSDEERGRLNGWMQAGMLVGRGLFGGAGLAVGLVLGQAAVVGSLLGLLVLSLLLHLSWAEAPREDVPPPEPGVPLGRALGRILAGVVRTRGKLAALGFALVGGAAYETAGALAGIHLADTGLDEAAHARFFALAVPGGMALGALGGGFLADRLGPRRTLALFALACAGLTAALAVEGTSPPTGRVALLYVAAGGFTAVSYALFMDVTERRVAATEFSLFMAATNVCESWAAKLGGALSTRHGAGAAFLVAAGLGAVAIALVPWISRATDDASDPAA